MPKTGEQVISIRGIDYILRRSIKNRIFFEAMGKGVDIESTFGVVLLFFATIMANNRDCALTLEEFMEALDEDETLLQTYSDWLTKAVEQDKVFEDKDEKKSPKVRKK